MLVLSTYMETLRHRHSCFLLPYIALVTGHVFAVRTHAWRLVSIRCEDPSVLFGDVRATVLALWHSHQSLLGLRAVM